MYFSLSGREGIKTYLVQFVNDIPIKDNVYLTPASEGLGE